MDKESTAPVQIGEVLAGKYRVARVLGAGGMGVVVEALHIELDQRVALKFMLPEAAANQAAVERFAREARASAKLRSDNVVHVTDVGTLDSGAPFMVMEFLEGEDLAEILKTSGSLSVHDAIDYVLQGCAGLAEAHAAGIIHRDLKPANLFLARRDDTVSVVKIVDFGISKVSVVGVADKLTRTSDLMGSPLYMSPEQLASSHELDARTDIWSLGIILYELLSGKPPFDGDTLPQVCAAVMITPAPPILEKRPDLPPGLSAIVAKCLEKKPSDRYAHVSDLADALAEFAPPHSTATLNRISRLAPGATRPPAPEHRPRLESMPEPHRETASPWTPAETASRVRAPVRKTAKRTWVVVASIAALAGIGGVFAFAPRHATPSRSVAPALGAPAENDHAAVPPPIVTPPAASTASASASAASASASPHSTAVAPTKPAATARPLVAPSAALPVAPRPAPPPSSAPSASAGPEPAPLPAPSAAPSAAPPPAPSAATPPTLSAPAPPTPAPPPSG